MSNRVNAAFTAPAARVAAVTPSDSVNLSVSARALYVGVGGDVTLLAEDDSVAVLFKAVPTGAVLPVRTKRVNSTGTTATNIVALL